MAVFQAPRFLHHYPVIPAQAGIYKTQKNTQLLRGHIFRGNDDFTVTQLCQLTHSPPCQGGVPRRAGVAVFQAPRFLHHYPVIPAQAGIYKTQKNTQLLRGHIFRGNDAFTVTQLCKLTHSPPCQGGGPAGVGWLLFKLRASCTTTPSFPRKRESIRRKKIHNFCEDIFFAGMTILLSLNFTSLIISRFSRPIALG